MTPFRKTWAAAVAALGLIGSWGCEDQLPTLGGAFPPDQVPTTLEVVLPAAEFLLSDTVFFGFDDPRDAPYLLAAREFDRVFFAHAVAAYTDFPDSVTYSSGGTLRTDRQFTYPSGRVFVVVDSAASSPRIPTTLQLWTLTQPWDSATVSWSLAVDRPGEQVPWRTPGGTLGTLVGEATWVPSDTVTRDTVAWQLDSLTVTRLARGEISGLLVRNAAAGSRLEFGGMNLRASIRPAGRQDTTLTVTVGPEKRTYIVTPDTPTRRGVLEAAGPRGARPVLRLDLRQQVSTCAAGGGIGCGTVPLREVTLDRVSLLLDPLPVPDGYRPLGATFVQVRRILEPELGRLSPLGEVLTPDTISASRFEAAGAREISLGLTGPIAELVNADSSSLALALLADPGDTDFGLLWFTSAPRLRIIYTVPPRPRLP